MAAIGAVVVLYGMSEEDSPAVRALSGDQSPLARSLFVVVHDNSEQPDRGDDGSRVVDERVADPTNPGLASAYTTALGLVEQAGCSWLMLLDQDTWVTDDYLAEVFDLVDRDIVDLAPASIDALVPVLQHAGRQVSPHARPRLRSPAIHVASHEPLPASAWYFNSGLVLRTEAVRRAGGFPESYPMDYLDHALARQMRGHGSVACQLDATLEHNLSVLETGPMSLSRYQSMSSAEERFAVDYGTVADRLWLVARRVVLALMAATGRYPSPSPSTSTEVRGILRAMRVAATRGQRA